MEPTVCEALLTRDHTKEGSEPLSSEDVSNYLVVLVRLASLDGFDVTEKGFIHRTAACLGLHPDLARNAHRFAANPSVTTEELVARIRDRGLRLCLLRDAYRLAAADGSVSPAEIGELANIAKALRIDHGAAASVKAMALQEARLQREFAQMVKSARA